MNNQIRTIRFFFPKHNFISLFDDAASDLTRPHSIASNHLVGMCAGCINVNFYVHLLCGTRQDVVANEPLMPHS